MAFRNRFDYGEGYFQVAEPTSDGFVFASATLSPTGTWPAREDAFSRCRSCFEVRTHRLCRRVLMFHHFQTELSVGDCLVRATQFTDQENAIATVLRGPTPSLVSHRALEIQGKPKLPPTAALKIIQLFFSIPTPASTQCVGSRRTGMLDIDLQRRTYRRRGYHPYLHAFRASEVREDLMGTNVGVPRTPTKASRPCDSARELGRSQCKAIWLDDWRRRNSALGSLPFQCFRRSAR